jgi:DNA-binding transcriptional LysR family regulator
MQHSLDDIAVFVEIVDQGSLRGAARRLGLSPSAVSKRLSALEARLELQLLLRTTRKQSLTQAGELLYEQVRTIPRDLAAAEEQLREATGRVQGVLRVVMPTWFESAVLYDRVVPAYLDAHPRVRLDLTLAADPLTHLDGEFDLLMAGRQPQQRFPDSSAVSRRLIRIRGALFATPAYLERHGRPEHPDQLKDHNCLGYPNPLWHFTAPDGQALVHRAEGNLRTNSHQLLRSATLAGMGITYSFPAFFDDDLRSGQVVRLLDDYTAGSFIEVHAFYPPARYRPVRTKAFVETLLAQLNDHAMSR